MFIEKEDFDQTVHDDILNAVTKGSDDKIDKNAKSTIVEVGAYLNGRYDVDAIFSKTEDDRNPFILKICLIITKYNLFLIHNPRKMTQSLKDEYDKTIADLEKIQAGKLNIVGLPVPEVEDGTNTQTGFPIQFGGDEQLGTNW